MSDPSVTSVDVESVIRERLVWERLETKIPAVDPVTRELNYTSVSALSKFNPEEYGGCPTRWWFKYVKGMKETQTVQQAEGVKGHTQIEHYLPTGEDVLGPIAAAGRHLLPRPSKEVLVEHGLNDKPRPPDVVVEIEPRLVDRLGRAMTEKKQVHFFPAEESMLRADGLPLIGFMDWINPTGWSVSPEGLLLQDPPRTVEAGDNKFTGNVNYAKTAEELVASTQMVGYAEFLTAKYPWVENVRASHVYFQTKRSRKAVKSTVLMPLEVIKKSWQKRGHDVVRTMRQVARIKNEAEVPANLNSCEAYHKACDFQHCCSKFQKQTPVDRLKSLILTPTNEVQTMTLLSKVKGSAPSNGANGAATNTPWAPVPAAPPAQLTARNAISGQSYRFSTGAVGQFIAATAIGADVAYSFVQVGADGKAGNQPFHVSPTEPITSLAPVEAPAAPVAAAPAAAPVATAPAPATAPAVVVSFESAPAGAAPKREPKLVLEPKTAAAPTAPTVEVKREPDAPAAPPSLAAQAGVAPKRAPAKAKKEATEATELRLFVACVPSGPYESLDAYIGPLLADLQNAHKVSDIRYAPDANHALAFGRWEGALAAAVRAFPPAGGDYVAFRGSKITDIVVETLVPLCGPGNVTRAL